jgi:hypothetical protein
MFLDEDLGLGLDYFYEVGGQAYNLPHIILSWQQ